ncbi:MAG: hypothetical protein WBH30_02880 [Bacillota bacterium]
MQGKTITPRSGRRGTPSLTASGLLESRGIIYYTSPGLSHELSHVPPFILVGLPDSFTLSDSKSSTVLARDVAVLACSMCGIGENSKSTARDKPKLGYHRPEYYVNHMGIIGYYSFSNPPGIL